MVVRDGHTRTLENHVEIAPDVAHALVVLYVRWVGIGDELLRMRLGLLGQVERQRNTLPVDFGGAQERRQLPVEIHGAQVLLAGSLTLQPLRWWWGASFQFGDHRLELGHLRSGRLLP